MEDIKEKLNELLTLLSNEQLNKKILKLENNTKNEKIIRYLEKIGSEEVKYKLNSEFCPGIIQEMEGVTRLWYKKSDGSWIIRLWEIRRLEIMK